MIPKAPKGFRAERNAAGIFFRAWVASERLREGDSFGVDGYVFDAGGLRLRRLNFVIVEKYGRGFEVRTRNYGTARWNWRLWNGQKALAKGAEVLARLVASGMRVVTHEVPR